MTTKSDRASKDTIYIDVDDEITAIIDKVVSSKHKIVALVLPRRATVLQSLVNMKLLKRSSEASGKHLVLVTTESGLMPLIGSVGLYAAKTPSSKPYIPGSEDSHSDQEEVVTEDNSEDFDHKAHAADSIGDLAEDDAIELDNDDVSAVAPTKNAKSATEKDKKAKKDKGSKKVKVPSFSSWRNKVLLSLAVLTLLVGGYIVAFVVIPRATIAIRTESDTVTKSIDLILSPAAQSAEESTNTLPARIETVERTITASADATGEENRGDRAEGTVWFSINQCPSQPADIPTGTGVSVGDKTYITQSTASFTPWWGGSCRTGNIVIRAQAGGSEYNTSGQADFTVAGRSNVTGKGSASGGTDEMVEALAQSDIEDAKKKLSSQASGETENAKRDLTARLGASSDTLIVLADSFYVSEPEINESAKAGDEVESVTVTQKTRYAMASIQRADLEQLIRAALSEELDGGKQVVRDYGINEASFKLQTYTDGTMALGFSSRVVIGPQIDEDSLREQAAGQKASEVEAELLTYPGVIEAKVTYSPFWVSRVPSSTSKITIEYQDSDQ